MSTLSELESWCNRDGSWSEAAPLLAKLLDQARESTLVGGDKQQ